MSPHAVVGHYFDQNMRVVFWPDVRDQKGPTENGWQLKTATLDEYDISKRVGLITATQIEPGKYLADIDIDYAPCAQIALKLIPKTNFVFGRKSKLVSHAVFTVPEAMPSRVFKDPIFNDNLIEFRCAKTDLQPGLQTMVPPSVWANKEGKREPLEFRGNASLADRRPAHITTVDRALQVVTLSATGMLLGRHLGRYGFGHAPRLAWAGFLLRLGVDPEDLITMGEALSEHCENTEVADVRRVVESTARNIEKEDKKVAGGPALAKSIGPSGSKIVAAIKKWFGVDQEFERDRNGKIVKDSQSNIRRATALSGVEVSYNLFAEKPLIQTEGGERRLLDDAALKELWLDIDTAYRFRPGIEFFQTVLERHARENSFHPVQDYLNGLVWDQKARINTWLKMYGGAVDPDAASEKEDPTYLEVVSALVLMAAVKRIYEPGCKYDEMLVLESPQGLKKSSALRALCPSDEWFSDDLPLNVQSKELIECCRSPKTDHLCSVRIDQG